MNDAEYVFPEVKAERDRQKWNAEVLKYNLKAIQKGKKYTFWHYKAAQKIAGTWDFGDTLKVFETDIDSVNLEAPQLEREHAENYVPESKNACKKCSNGWRLDHKTKLARPYGCNKTVVEAYKEYVMKNR
jgi:hypothetical protein